MDDNDIIEAVQDKCNKLFLCDQKMLVFECMRLARKDERDRMKDIFGRSLLEYCKDLIRESKKEE